ncbi:MAG TPA: hypothetical protein VGO11_26965 [Chthoniobacteraceae bacterium]|jgi:hypothetical protein|nr:hypothetical protein [Chthoniobacteraceae bacterium]
MHTDPHTCTSNTTHPATKPAPIPGKAFLLKTCRTCGEEKPLRAFYQQRRGRKRYRKDCIACVKAEVNAARKVRQANKDRGSRRCPQCRETLPIADFLEDLRCRSGHRKICKRCEAQLEARRAERREALNRPDKLIPRHSDLRERRIDLGIAIAHATCPPGHCRTREEIAAYTGLTVEAVRRIEVRALWKMRLRVQKALQSLGLEDLVKEGTPQ